MAVSSAPPSAARASRRTQGCRLAGFFLPVPSATGTGPSPFAIWCDIPSGLLIFVFGGVSVTALRHNLHVMQFAHLKSAIQIFPALLGIEPRFSVCLASILLGSCNQMCSHYHSHFTHLHRVIYIYIERDRVLLSCLEPHQVAEAGPHLAVLLPHEPLGS